MNRRYLYCAKCDSEASADPGDYWNAPDDHVFKCCGENMWLVEKRGRFTGDGILLETVAVNALRALEKVKIT